MTRPSDILAFAVAGAGLWTPAYAWLFALDRPQSLLTFGVLLAVGLLLGSLIFGLLGGGGDRTPPAPYRLKPHWRR